MKRLIYFLLSLLGFTAQGCDGIDNPFDDPVAMYGCPYANFTLSARVVTEEGEPIKDIILRNSDNNSILNVNVSSDQDGNILIKDSIFPPSLVEKMEIVFEDVDGEANGGEFATVEMDISDKVEQVAEGDGDWYFGGYKADLGDVVLTPKQEAEERDDN